MTGFFDKSAQLKLKPFMVPAARIVDELANSRDTLEDEFLVDPSGFLASRLYGVSAKRIPRANLNAANQFIFSALSNSRFREWVAQYENKLADELATGDFSEIDKDRLRLDLAQALIDSAEPGLLLPIMGRNSLDCGPKLTIDPDMFDVDGTIGAAVQVSAIITGTPVVSGSPTPVITGAPVVLLSGVNPTVADVAVEIETLAYAVAVAAVFVAVVGVVLAATRHEGLPPNSLTRRIALTGADLNQISEALVHRANQLREAGKL